MSSARAVLASLVLASCAAEAPPPDPDVTPIPAETAEDLGPVATISVASLDVPTQHAGDPTLPVEARFLVLSADGSEPELAAIRSVLDHRGTPYDVFIATQQTLTADRLRAGAHGFYQATILTSSSLAISGTSTLSATEWAILADYEEAFMVRRAVLAAWPDPALGFGSSTTVNTSASPLTVRCTTAGAAVFRDVNCGADQRIQGDAAYLARPAAGAPLTPLVTDTAGNALIATHEAADGRESILLLFRQHPSRLHSHLFLHGVLGWVSGGTYLGERRIDLGVQVDDLFLASNVWGGGTYRIDDDDLRALRAWVLARRATATTPDFRIALAFNGTRADDGDPLTEEARAHSADWHWINHGYTHTLLDALDYDAAYQELAANLQVAQDLPLLGFDPRSLVTGNYSGLVNPYAMRAARDLGIRYAVMDTSKPGCNNPSPNTTFYNAVEPSILLVPRRPNNLFYNVSTPAQWVGEYNELLGESATYPEVLDQESDVLVRYLLRGEADPWMFHQANLRAYDGTHSLLGDLVDATLAKLAARVDVPVRTPPMQDLGLRFARRVGYEGAGVRATLFRGRALVIDAGRAVEVPVTGVRAADGEAYGGDVLALVDVVPGTSTCVPLDAAGTGCAPPPVREGGAGPVVALPTGYCDGHPGGDPPPPPPGDEVTVIPRRSTWRFWDRGGDLGTGWRARTFDDSAWTSGAGPLGYGESYVATPVSYGPSAVQKHITTYFRRSFTVADAGAATAILGELMYDDGAVVYLNGVEIGRASMPSGTVIAATLSTGHEAGNTYRAFDWSARTGLLVDGTNTIAVEVHQASATSSDLVFDLALTIETSGGEPPPPPPPPEVGGVPRNATWWYWDSGGDLGTAWRTSSGGAGWDTGPGPLGYGESYVRTTVSYGPSSSSKYITTYFTRTFQVEDPAAVRSMLAEVMYDDGFVAYLNGVELGRGSMPIGTVTASTLSSGHEAGNAYVTYDWSARANLLVAGTNTIAVEVHQAAASSSDLVFDLALTLDTSAPPPPPPVDEGVPRNAIWWYWDDGGDLGTAWRTQVGGSGWSNGPGPLGYGESYVRTTVSYGPSATSKYITTYFTRSFTVDDPAAVTRMLAEVMYDDGFVAYLNGVEIARAYLPTGTITASTLSPGHETGNRYEALDWSARRDLLVAGTNVLAVEVHQAAPTSSDLTFDLALILE